MITLPRRRLLHLMSSTSAVGLLMVAAPIGVGDDNGFLGLGLNEARAWGREGGEGGEGGEGRRSRGHRGFRRGREGGEGGEGRWSRRHRRFRRGREGGEGGERGFRFSRRDPSEEDRRGERRVTVRREVVVRETEDEFLVRIRLEREFRRTFGEPGTDGAQALQAATRR